jgi:hypothetical protein
VPSPKFQRNCAPLLPSVPGLNTSWPLTSFGPPPIPGSPMMACPRSVFTSVSDSTRP